ncbi:MAG: ATP-dependent DNA helicase RecG [Bacteroidales bacterium]
MGSILDTEIKFLTGIGPKRADLLNKELQIATYRDFLYHFPFRYIDKTQLYSTREISEDMPYIQLKGKIVEYKQINAAQKRLVATFQDEYGSIELVWFKGLGYIQKNTPLNQTCIIFGKPTAFNGKYSIVHPEIESTLKEDGKLTSAIQGVYRTTERLKNNGLGIRSLQRLQNVLLSQVLTKISETLPEYILRENNLLSLSESLLNIHFPKDYELLKKAQDRLKFEELFYIQLGILRQRSQRQERNSGFSFKCVGKIFNSFYHQYLPFPLTNAQKRVLKEIHADTCSGKQMNRLLQGDVGSGKTIIALMSALLATDNGFQSCLMAPTEILARQHFTGITELLKGLSIKVALLTGSTKKAARKQLFEELKNGEIQILIGTHALVEEAVQFKNLALVIIDEQHRFGVAQRGKLWEKNLNPPHILVMTATPIPRTLAMTIYGDLHISILDELPPGRKPIKTQHYFEHKRGLVFDFLRKQIAEGRQIYMVYPLIQESEKFDYKNLSDGFEMIQHNFPAPKYQTCILHGKMKNDEKDTAMQEFIEGKANIMVATTVIEVGVNVPNASVMLIESAERFGLAQLHQLRGRVGRGANQSYCILMTGSKISNDSRRRIDMMCRSNDGFEIAEADLQMRGPGDLEGTMQSGLAFNLRIANLAKDGKVLDFSRFIAEKVLNEDPYLNQKHNALLRLQLTRLQKSTIDYSSVS